MQSLHSDRTSTRKDQDPALSLALKLAPTFPAASVSIFRHWHPQAPAECLTTMTTDSTADSVNLDFQEGHYFILLAGCAGSGKTTWVRRTLSPFHPTHLSADHFCVDLDQQYTFTHEGMVASHVCCKWAFSEAVARKDRLIVVDGSHLMKHHRQPYLDWARKHDYFLLMVVLDATSEVAAARNIHGATIRGVQRQRLRLDIEPGIHFVATKSDRSWKQSNASGLAVTV